MDISFPEYRHLTAIAAGSGCLNYATFARYAYPGGILWCTVFLSLGYYAGDRWSAVAHSARSHLALGAGVLAAAAATYVIVRVLRQRAADSV